MKRIFICISVLFCFPFSLFGSIEKQFILRRNVDIEGNVLDLNTTKYKYLLILFFNPLNTDDKWKLAYAQVLHHKYKNSGLEVIGTSTADKNILLEFHAYGNFSFPFIHDSDKQIFNEFKIRECCGGTVLINSDDETVFNISYLLNRENLRQIVEKNLLGEIANSFVPSTINIDNRLRDILPKLPLLDVESGRIKFLSDLKEPIAIITFTSFICPMCKMSERIETLKRIKTDFQQMESQTDYILIFFKPFNENDVNEWASRLEIPFTKYISYEDIFSNEEKYITDPSLIFDPLTIVLRDAKDFEFVENLGTKEEELVKEIETILNNSIRN